ncbi:MAG: glycosyltransferase, partial [Acidimicrobiales bacterium]
DYTKLIDDHEVYICTSYQEGGPIPAMDAMQRGCAVLSTPVGQIQELIRHGENGYICETADEFIEALTVLANDLPLLHRMRLRSLETFHRERNIEHIQALAASVINEVVARDQASVPYNGSDAFGAATWLWQKNVHNWLSGRVATETKALLGRLPTKR